MIDLTYGIRLTGGVTTGSAYTLDGRVDTGSINVGGNVICNMVTSTREYEDYTGPYVVTPTQGTQVLLTDDKHMTGNVTINPIPSNYGLITWNGSYLTVS